MYVLLLFIVCLFKIKIGNGRFNIFVVDNR